MRPSSLYRQLTLPLVFPDPRLVAARAALATADHAAAPNDRRRATAALGAKLADLAVARGRFPAKRPGRNSA